MTPQELRDLRSSLGRTQEGMAGIIETSLISYQRWEQGRAKPSPVYQRRLDKLKKLTQEKGVGV